MKYDYLEARPSPRGRHDADIDTFELLERYTRELLREIQNERMEEYYERFDT